MNLSSLGTTIRELREMRGWGQRELAQRADVRKHQVSQWENATYTPQLENLQKIAAAFDAAPSDLLKDAGL